MTAVYWMSATELAKQVRAGHLTASEVAEIMISRIDDVNPVLNAIIYYDRDQIRRDARRLDEIQESGVELGALHGVPYSIKDLTAVKGLPLTLGMRPLKENIAPADAPIVERMKAAEGLFIGKTNTPEAGYAGKTTNHLFGATRNPWNTSMSAGGSSGGAGSAMAAGMGQLAEGSDGGGSIRVPAAFNGVFGLKPSTGRIPETVTADRWLNYAAHGPITRSVEDAALMMDVCAGPDERDPKTLPASTGSYVEEIKSGIEGWRIAYSPALTFFDVDREVAMLCGEAVAELGRLGAEVVEASPEWDDPKAPMFTGLWVPGMAAMRDMFPWDNDGMKGVIDEELIDMVLSGDRVTATEIARAAAARGRMYDIFVDFMRDYRILATPTTTCPTWKVDQFTADQFAGKALVDQFIGWAMTYPFNMMTNPACSIPVGFTRTGLPVGLQLVGHLHADGDVLRAARNLESVRPWTHLYPDAVAKIGK